MAKTSCFLVVLAISWLVGCGNGAEPLPTDASAPTVSEILQLAPDSGGFGFAQVFVTAKDSGNAIDPNAATLRVLSAGKPDVVVPVSEVWQDTLIFREQEDDMWAAGSNTLQVSVGDGAGNVGQASGTLRLPRLVWGNTINVALATESAGKFFTCGDDPRLFRTMDGVMTAFDPSTTPPHLMDAVHNPYHHPLINGGGGKDVFCGVGDSVMLVGSIPGQRFDRRLNRWLDPVLSDTLPLFHDPIANSLSSQDQFFTFIPWGFDQLTQMEIPGGIGLFDRSTNSFVPGWFLETRGAALIAPVTADKIYLAGSGSGSFSVLVSVDAANGAVANEISVPGKQPGQVAGVAFGRGRQNAYVRFSGGSSGGGIGSINTETDVVESADIRVGYSVHGLAVDSAETLLFVMSTEVRGDSVYAYYSLRNPQTFGVMETILRGRGRFLFQAVSADETFPWFAPNGRIILIPREGDIDVFYVRN